ncbi:MAG: YggS family pyridoxal phosphate-dependent enzyme [Gammaproteobacteria bacterium]|nr:YggS family pyridoxal phosphate-dependent enzyme [Gammaproteobacteria bacterium]
MHKNIKDRFWDISEKIQSACHQAQRSPEDIKLIAVSKLQSIEVINEAYENGINDFGENYAQELAKKSEVCPKDITWHFIGPIQSNKANLIAKYADWVHSIDRQKVAKKLNDALNIQRKKIHVLIQVNINLEESKSGIHPNDAIDLAKDINTNYKNLTLEGLMFMPKINASKKVKMETMRNISNLQAALIKELPNCKNISLGTSADFEEAIFAGSTMIRIGESLLGPRA